MRGGADQGRVASSHSPSTKVQVVLRGAVLTAMSISLQISRAHVSIREVAELNAPEQREVKGNFDCNRPEGAKNTPCAFLSPPASENRRWIDQQIDRAKGGWVEWGIRKSGVTGLWLDRRSGPLNPCR